MNAESFGELLRRYRLRARLTQEALAESAGMSARSVRDIERNRDRAPRPRTAERLARALALTDDERTAFLHAAEVLFWAARTPGSDPAGTPLPDLDAEQPAHEPTGPWPVQLLPADTADFVGREAELSLLRAALEPAGTGPRLAAVSGPPGVGKPHPGI
jgi:transcriptional regulator with XRE-family HTH domain